MGVTERKAREKQERRSRIMDAAKQVFCREGFTGTTMEEIARQAELSPATLYLYFKNKNELYASLNLRMLQFLCQRVEQVSSEDLPDPVQKVRNLAQAMYDVYRFDPMILTNVFHMQASEALRGLSGEMIRDINDMSTKALRTMATIFEDGMERGIFQRHHPIALADLVWAIFSGLVMWEESKRLFDPRKDHLKPTLDLALDLLARGLCVEQPALTAAAAGEA